MSQKQSLPAQISIVRLDIHNRPDNGRGYNYLPNISSLDDITDVNEIRSISLGKFYSKTEVEALRNSFPKSYKASYSTGWDQKEGSESGNCDFENPYYSVYFRFNTFFMDGTTGSSNETAAQRRLKVIDKIKKYLQTL